MLKFFRRKKNIRGYKTSNIRSNTIGVYNTYMSRKNKYGRLNHKYKDHFGSNVRYMRYE